MKDFVLYDNEGYNTEIILSEYKGVTIDGTTYGKMPYDSLRIEVKNDFVLGDEELIIDILSEQAIKLRDWLLKKYPI